MRLRSDRLRDFLSLLSLSIAQRQKEEHWLIVNKNCSDEMLIGGGGGDDGLQ